MMLWTLGRLDSYLSFISILLIYKELNRPADTSQVYSPSVHDRTSGRLKDATNWAEPLISPSVAAYAIESAALCLLSKCSQASIVRRLNRLCALASALVPVLVHIGLSTAPSVKSRGGYRPEFRAASHTLVRNACTFPSCEFPFVRAEVRA